MNFTVEHFELLCRDGGRLPITEYQQCNWGVIPSDAIVTSSARTMLQRRKYQQFLQKVVELYSDYREVEDTRHQHYTSTNNQNNYNSNSNYYNQFTRTSTYRNNERLNENSFTTDRNSFITYNDSVLYEKFRIFESKRYGKTNLLFQVCLN